MGPLAANSSGRLENSQCAISPSGGVPLGSQGFGTDLIVSLPLTLKGAYLTGARNAQFWVTDQDGLGTGWQTGGVWHVGANFPPQFISGTLTTEVGASATFIMGVRDPNGPSDISRVYFVLNSSGSVSANSCHGFYDRQANSIFLYNDSLTQLMPNSITPGIAGTVQNGQCSIDGAASSLRSVAPDLVVAVRFTRRGGFIGTTKNFYLWTVDNGGTGTGWVQQGIWTP